MGKLMRDITTEWNFSPGNIEEKLVFSMIMGREEEVTDKFPEMKIRSSMNSRLEINSLQYWKSLIASLVQYTRG